MSRQYFDADDLNAALTSLSVAVEDPSPLGASLDERGAQALLARIASLEADKRRLDWLFSGWEAGQVVLVKMTDGKWAVCFGNESDDESANVDGRLMLDAAMAAESEGTE